MVYATAALGLVILLFAGDLLVKGAVNAALRLGIPALLVSLTIVAFGTSAPELLVSVEAVWKGVPGLALGNVVGSNTANVLLVLGLPAIISTLGSSDVDTRKSYLTMLAATALFVLAALLGPITWMHGLILLGMLAFVLTGQAREALAHRALSKGEPEVEGLDPSLRWWRILSYLAVGLVGLPLGATLLVDSATEIAGRFGVSDGVIGLTLVAIGTSLPELATTVSAAIRRQADVALGNVIGSNLFNLLAIVGIASLFRPMPVPPSFLTLDLWVMVAASLVLAPFVFSGWNIGRRIGVGLFGLYIVYLAAVVVTG